MDRKSSSLIFFSWKQFWISLLYENLPPVIGSPLAALAVERSPSKAWNVCQNRNLMVLSTRYNPAYFIVFSWLVVYPGSWLITAGLVISLFFDSQTLWGIDPLQVMCAYAFLFCRRLIIAVKYGYFSSKEFNLLSEPAPDWDFEKGSSKLIAVGWSSPLEHPGLVEAELAQANEQTDGGLDQPPSTERRSRLKRAARAVIEAAYGLKAPSWYNALIAVSVLTILFSLVFSKFYFDQPIIGEQLQVLIANLASYAGILAGMGIMGFGLLCAFDFERRRVACEVVSRMLVSVSKVDNPHEFVRKSPADLRDWLSLRRVIRSFGERYRLRVQAYTSILLCFAILCVALLNFLAWTKASHHLSTIAVLLTTTFVIAFIGSFAMRCAIQLQQQSYIARSELLTYLLEAEIEVDSDSAAKDSSDLSKDKTRRMLKLIDEYIDFSEIVHKPITVLGYRADGALIASVLGILVTGLLLAVQGFAESGIAYDHTGWANING